MIHLELNEIKKKKKKIKNPEKDPEKDSEKKQKYNKKKKQIIQDNVHFFQRLKNSDLR